MKNAYDALNSKDIRDYLIKINYKFKPEEELYVILSSRQITIEEKHELLEDLGERYHDFIVEKRRSEIESQTLKEFVKNYIKATDSLIKKFYQENDRCIYFSSFLWDEGFTEYGTDTYKNFDDAFKAYWCDDNELQHKLDTLLRIKKKNIDTNEEIDVTFLLDKSIMKISTSIAEQFYDYLHYYEWMWVDIPTPFKHGDILYYQNYKRHYSCDDVYHEKVFVLDELQTWDKQDYIDNGFIEGVKGINGINRIDYTHLDEKRKSHLEIGDESDMCLIGRQVDTHGKITYDHVWTYLDFEYYRGDLVGEYTILKLLSNYYKGEIDEELLLNAYYILRNRASAERDETYLGYDDEALIMAGLKGKTDK